MTGSSVYIGNTGNEGRNLLPLKDSKYLSEFLYLIGRRNPPIKVKDFIQALRRDEGKKMSYEYKILKRLCPVFYGRMQDPIVRIINNPYEHYQSNKAARPLWTGAFVKLVLDEETENDYRLLLDCYQNGRQDYRLTTNKSFLKEAKFTQQRGVNELIEKAYAQAEQLQAAINSIKRKDLGLCLTFRGLLAYLFSEYKCRKKVEKKKGDRELDEKERERATEREEALRTTWRGRIRQVIRNPSVIKEAPFLEDSDSYERSGFDATGLLLQMSTELIDQLHIDTDNDCYLLRRASDRYLAEFNRFFFDGLGGAVKKRYPMNVAISLGIPLREDEEQGSIVKRRVKRTSVISTLNEYRKKMALQRRAWLLNDLKEIDSTINKSLEMEDTLKKEHKGSR